MVVLVAAVTKTTSETMTVTQWRIQALEFLDTQGLPAFLARPAEAAIFQAHNGDRDVYNLFVEELIHVYAENADAEWTHGKLVAAAKAPLVALEPDPQPAVRVGAARHTSMYVCPDCKTREFPNIPFEDQQRGADEGANQYRQCLNPECQHVWEIKTR